MGFSHYKFSILITVSGWYYHFDLPVLIYSFNSAEAMVVVLASLRWSATVSIKLSQIGSFH